MNDSFQPCPAGPAVATNQAESPSSAASLRASLSIIIPTRNRAGMLAQVVRKTRDYAAGHTVEWIVIDDGSTDETRQVLAALQREIPNLTFRTVPNGGQDRARNLAASLAKHDVLLFMGDDVLPANEDFLRLHAEMHANYRSPRFAVLGKVIWPGIEVTDVNPLTGHLPEIGCGGPRHTHFRPYEFLDWRVFYARNVSVKRNLVADWIKDGFAAQFNASGLEDSEFAYRMSSRPGGFEVFYSPSSLGYHLQPYDVSHSIRSHSEAGALAATLLDLYPELSSTLGLNEIKAAMQVPLADHRSDRSADFLAIFEGIKSWARLLGHEERLGNDKGHDALLFAALEISYLQGYIAAAARANTNFDNVYARVMERAKLHPVHLLDSKTRSDAMLARS